MRRKPHLARSAFPAPRPIVQVKRIVFLNISLDWQNRSAPKPWLPQLFPADSPSEFGCFWFITLLLISNFVRRCINAFCFTAVSCTS